MGDLRSDSEKKALVDRLLRQAHEQSSRSAERAPFWREGAWRCEFYTRPAESLKLFSGERCVYEEPVPDVANAVRRSEELHRDIVRGKTPRD